MLRRLAVVFALCLAFGTVAELSAKGSGSKGASAGQKGSKSSDGGKTVHVKEYTRKDGTKVRAHDRKAPDSRGMATTTVESTPRTSTPSTASSGERDANGQIHRSAAAKNDFMRQTSYSHGRPGYVVDHIMPLACGGADTPSNMQWQTVADAKAKDKTERIGCGSFSRAPTTTGIAVPTVTTSTRFPSTFQAPAPIGNAVVAQPAASTPLAGLNEREIRARLGSPSLTSAGVWYYDRPKGTLRVYFADGVVSRASPWDFDLGDVTPATAPAPSAPAAPQPTLSPGGVIALCRDGSYVLAPHKNGVCYGHGGVAEHLGR